MPIIPVGNATPATEPDAPADQAAYDAWLTEVQESLDEDAPSISHEEAMRMVRAALLAT